MVGERTGAVGSVECGVGDEGEGEAGKEPLGGQRGLEEREVSRDFEILRLAVSMDARVQVMRAAVTIPWDRIGHFNSRPTFRWYECTLSMVLIYIEFHLC